MTVVYEEEDDGLSDVSSKAGDASVYTVRYSEGVFLLFFVFTS